ncbi:MAG: serine/threonine-protein kinase [Myxococcota bacterium]
MATELLGEGGTAKVFRAWDNHAERWCALKVLFEKYALKKASRRRFIDEGHTVITLNHRNVIEAWDLVDDTKQPFLVMEIAEGGSLRDWVERNGPMSPLLAVDVAIQISKGIGAAHKMGVVHRDIKPHNILLNRRGLCKVTDFGIAQIVRQDGTTDVPDWTKTHHNTAVNVAGTRGYMAPEQLQDGKAADIRTDIYGIGATLYTLLTGRVDTNLFAVDQDPGLTEGIHPELLPVVIQSTRFRPEERYQTVQELAKVLFDLKDALPALPPHAPGLSPNLPPEPPAPYDSTRNTRLSVTRDSHSSSSNGLASAPPAPGSVPPTPPPGLQSRSPAPGFTPPSRGTRRRANLILQHSSEADFEDGSPRTRPLIVVSAVIGIFACVVTYDTVSMRMHQARSWMAHQMLVDAAVSHSSVVDVLGEGATGRVEPHFQQLMDARTPRASLDASTAYIDALKRERTAELAPKNAAVVGRAIISLEEHQDELGRELESWRSAASFPGLVVSLGLEPAPL